MQNEFISIQAAADEYGISTRWIWKSIRVDRTLGAVVRNGRIYLHRIEWEAFVERHPRLIEEWHDLHVYCRLDMLDNENVTIPDNVAFSVAVRKKVERTGCLSGSELQDRKSVV